MPKPTSLADQAAPPSEVEVNALSVSEFCKRNGMCRTTFYRAAAVGDLRVVKFYGRTVVLAEDEAAWRRKLKAGALSQLPPRKPPRRAEAPSPEAA